MSVDEATYLRASNDYHPPAIQNHTYPNWDDHQRTLNVYFDDDPTILRLMIAFWITCIRSGDMAIRPGPRRIYAAGSRQPCALELHFVEDQLLNMNRTIAEHLAFNDVHLAVAVHPHVLAQICFKIAATTAATVAARPRCRAVARSSGDSVASSPASSRAALSL
jgi:hypothetical protein